MGIILDLAFVIFLSFGRLQFIKQPRVMMIDMVPRVGGTKEMSGP